MRCVSLLVTFLLGNTLAQEAGPWRSALYPTDWTPKHSLPDARFLHDFSYAGYRSGAKLPKVAGPEFVVQGVDATGATDVTAALQKAIDDAGAKGGGVVRLPAGLYRCDGTLTIRTSGVVLRGDGPDKTKLFFNSVPKRGWSNHLSIAARAQNGTEAKLARDAANRSFFVEVTKGEALKAGQEISIGWTITPEFVAEHGMTGTWKSFNGKWRPIFLRTITRIDREQTPVRVYLDVPLRYPAQIRDGASVRLLKGYVSECGIEDLGIANAVSWKAAWSRAGVHAIGLAGARDCWVRNVRSFPSPHPEAKSYHLQNGGIIVAQSRFVTIAECDLRKAQNRGGGGAGYLFEITRSNEILTRDCVGIAGRHNFIQNWDFGASGLVWLRCRSANSRSYKNILDPIGWPAYCEFHHSLAMGCLIDSCQLDDGWFGGNRHNWSSGAGNTVTQTVYWNTTGKGKITSWQDGHGYIIGTRGVKVETSLKSKYGRHTAPEDTREGIGAGATLRPVSLYEDQRQRRIK
ncbi:MAG: hypothetical protein HN380_11755 [Victivallales bacterium]|nr:hypothetical protein [Victivallales bacterium]